MKDNPYQIIAGWFQKQSLEQLTNILKQFTLTKWHRLVKIQDQRWNMDAHFQAGGTFEVKCDHI